MDMQGGLADIDVPSLPAGLTANYFCDIVDMPITAATTYNFTDLLAYQLSASRTQCSDDPLSGPWSELAEAALATLLEMVWNDGSAAKVVSSKAMVRLNSAVARLRRVKFRREMRGALHCRLFQSEESRAICWLLVDVSRGPC